MSQQGNQTLVGQTSEAPRFTPTTFIYINREYTGPAVEESNEENLAEGGQIIHTDIEGEFFLIEGGVAVPLSSKPGMALEVESTGGSVFSIFTDSWTAITGELLSSRAYGMMIAFLFLGFSVGSIGKLPMCMMSTYFRPAFCNQITYSVLALCTAVLAYMSWMQIPEDDDSDPEEQWQVWVLGLAILGSIVIIAMGSMQQSSYGGTMGGVF